MDCKPGAGRAPIPALMAALLLSLPAYAATITVNVGSDEDAANGSCSLREAIIAANTDADYNGCVGAAAYGTDVIVFAIPGAGPHIISLATALPDITTPVQIYGYSQAGSSMNNTASGTNAVLQVGIANGAGVANGFTFGIGAAGSSLAGLRITGFSGPGVLVTAVSDVTVSGNFIGTDGVNDLGNAIGVYALNGASNITIGGPAEAQRNLISGNNAHGVLLQNPTTGNVTIQNNLIGTTADGNTPLFGASGIYLGAAGSDIAITGNVIGGEEGIRIWGGSDSVAITANSIGVGVDGSTDIGGADNGIYIRTFLGGTPHHNVIGGTNPADGNLIANWGSDGVNIERDDAATAFPYGNQILGNRIAANGGLGINLVDSAGGTGAGANPNDIDDTDDGPNGYQNFPLITAATTNGVNTAVSFSLDGPPTGSNYRLEFFSSPSCDTSGYGEGAVYLGASNWLSGDGDVDGTGNSLPATTPGEYISATATLLDTDETSEFSACYRVTSGAVTSGGVASPAGDIDSIPTLPAWGLVLLSLILTGTAGTFSRTGVRFTPNRPTGSES
ncbi:IPTL-CTERM sorting domain-containing protein [Haliea sp. E17]|uniref:IPTL-CTERM sorting domain-containing protein n=1 Tax=Haliea sp. E17 TaxID=3401576 RepID=UPI003AB105B1